MESERSFELGSNTNGLKQAAYFLTVHLLWDCIGKFLSQTGKLLLLENIYFKRLCSTSEIIQFISNFKYRKDVIIQVPF